MSDKIKTIKDAIKNPRVTEKASGALEKNIYIFNVDMSANKKEIGKAIFSLYKVKPVKINILPVPYKKIMSMGNEGVRGGGKKAVVYLKEGDKIEFI